MSIPRCTRLTVKVEKAMTMTSIQFTKNNTSYRRSELLYWDKVQYISPRHLDFSARRSGSDFDGEDRYSNTQRSRQSYDNEAGRRSASQDYVSLFD